MPANLILAKTFSTKNIDSKPKLDNIDKNMVEIHREKYQNSKDRINLIAKNIEEILEVREYLITSRINCFKYNTSLDECV